mmetsp:Transcript_26432/g.66517  ORF Transcript_26432/g.66517 Transcript_26432/m.66517 type:complete len:676 (+) Transcript_26432:291-2318(+)
MRSTIAAFGECARNAASPGEVVAVLCCRVGGGEELNVEPPRPPILVAAARPAGAASVCGAEGCRDRTGRCKGGDHARALADISRVAAALDEAAIAVAAAAAAAAAAAPPPPRGRQAVMQRMASSVFGVASPRRWGAQLEEVEGQCRRDVAAVAATCRPCGQKFTDPDFPPQAQSLFTNGSRPSSSSRMPKEVVWRRASELVAAAALLEVVPDSQLHPGAIDDTSLLGAVALLRAAGRAPEQLIVQADLSVGVVGVRLFKDGEWVHEVIDDFLPCCCAAADGAGGGTAELACGRSSSPSEVWLALVEKANAKIHGSYEAVQRSTELESLEDFSGAALRRVDRRELAAGSDLKRSLGARQQLGAMHLAVRRRERRGEEHACGLLSGHGYPLFAVDETSCRLDNPWPRGGFRGSRPSYSSTSSFGSGTEEVPESFTMDVAEVLEHFTEILEVRVPPPEWPCYRVSLSTDRPSYPMMSARGTTQCLLTACQPDRRWSRQDSYLNGLGLRVYRCRFRAPPTGMQGKRQDPKANPFEPLELIRRRPLGKTRSTCLEFTMEAHALYVVVVDSQYRCPRCMLRFACSADVSFRELSAPEAGHFLAAQPGAADCCVAEGELPPSGGRGGATAGLQKCVSEASTEVGSGSGASGPDLQWHVEAIVKHCAFEPAAKSGWWPFRGCF